MNIFHRLSGSLPKGRRSWWPAIFVPLVWTLVFSYRAEVESDSATRQQTSLASIGQCKHVGRGNQNYCDYTFSVGDQQYTAVNRAPEGLEIGQTVTAYYDSGDPQISALQDFSKQSRHDLRFLYIFLTVFAIVVAFVLWRAPYRETSDKQLLEIPTCTAPPKMLYPPPSIPPNVAL